MFRVEGERSGKTKSLASRQPSSLHVQSQRAGLPLAWGRVGLLGAPWRGEQLGLAGQQHQQDGTNRSAGCPPLTGSWATAINSGRHKAMRPGRWSAEWHMLPSWRPPPS